MNKEPNNQDDSQLYALSVHDMDTMRIVLSLLRQIGIMMWAYRFDHARYTMQRLRQNYDQFLQRGRDAAREQEFYSKEFSDSFEDASFSLRQNQDIAIAGIATKVDFLATRLNMAAGQTRPDNRRFEYGLLQLEDNIITIRTYRFDDVAVVPLQYLDAFQDQQNFNLVMDQQSSDYPLSFRLFSNTYFAEIMVFASDYAEIRLTSANQNEELINTLIRVLNSTRKDDEK